MLKRPILLIVISIATVLILVSGAVMLSQGPKEVASRSEFANMEDVSVMLASLKTEAESGLAYPKDFGGKSWQVIKYCSTRKSVLKAESDLKQSFVAGHKCKTGVGHWVSPYDGKPTNRALDLEIDHMVPKAEAWQSGAWKWGKERQKAFKNDLGYGPSLIAISKSENGPAGKWDKEPGRNSKDSKDYYLPPREEYVCTYVAEWIAVKWRWSLSANPEEKSNLQELLNFCRGEINIPWPAKATLPSEH